jgi:phosphoribosylaminoimidazole-succinocarboxamide synthase
MIQTKRLIGEELSERVRKISIALYCEAAEYALSKGIVIADTKFEFGMDVHGQLLLIDEILTPDSSRYWKAAEVESGIAPSSLDKQPLRDWLEQYSEDGRHWNKLSPPPRLPQALVHSLRARYNEILSILIAD